MNLAQTYSLATGLKIKKPFLLEHYFPIPFDEYITLQNSSGMGAKNYDYWQDVINLILPYLNEKGIKIIQLGDKDTQGLKGCINLGGKTNFHQTAYLIRRAKLHMGNDSWLAHLAPSLDVPLIALYGSTRPSNHGPHFGDANKNILIESHRNGAKPSFVAQENPKSINLIKPEDVASAILKQLNIKNELSIETLYIGRNYNQFMVDVVPDSIVSPEFIKGGIFNLRMDYLFHEENLIKNLSIRKFQITTDKPIKSVILKKFQNNIQSIIYEIGKDYNLDFIKELGKNTIPFILITKLSQDELNEIKLSLMDYGIIHQIQKTSKESLENHEKMSISSLYRTNRFVLGRNKVYLSKSKWERDIPIKSFEDNVSNLDFEDSDFFDNAEFMYIFNNQ